MGAANNRTAMGWSQIRSLNIVIKETPVFRTIKLCVCFYFRPKTHTHFALWIEFAWNHVRSFFAARVNSASTLFNKNSRIKSKSPLRKISPYLADRWSWSLNVLLSNIERASDAMSMSQKHQKWMRLMETMSTFKYKLNFKLIYI